MMYTLGDRTRSGDVVDLLLACHHRMREHLALARRLAQASGLTSPQNVRLAAGRVRAYFALAYPLHRADEEQDVFPMLVGQSAVVDAALAELVDAHAGQEAHIESLLEICAALEQDPSLLEASAATLAAELQAFERDLVAHIRLEERAVFPAIARLPIEAREALHRRMRARRDESAAQLLHPPRKPSQ